MVTSQNDRNLPSAPQGRAWSEFAIKGYSAIVARKHGIAVPLGDIESLSDEELDVRLRLVTDLAHLPPA